jgi:hypothetical protein
MERVYTAQDIMIVGHLEAVLQGHRVDCVVKNRFLTGGAGELPPTDVWPEIWVTEADAPRAREIIAGVLAEDGQVGPDWNCPDCGERVEGQFAECWNCQASAPEN